MVAMMFNGFDADAHLRGYFFGCFRFRDQKQCLDLPHGERHDSFGIEQVFRGRGCSP